MDRSTARLLVALVLAGFGIFRAVHVPAMLVGPTVPVLLLVGFVLQALLGIAAGVGTWRGASWAPTAILLFGASIAATALVEAFVLGVIAYLRALLEAVVAIVVTVFLAGYVREGFAAARATDGER